MRHWIAAIAALPLLAASGARADDTDIYISNILPPTSVPMVMFSLDTSSASSATYAGCANVGTGAGMCSPAAYFRDNCPTCVLPGATQPLTYFHVMKYAIRMTLLQMTGVKVGLMLSHNNENNCAGPRPAGVLNASQRCSNGGYIARGFKLADQVIIPAVPLLGMPASTGPGPNTTEFLAILDALPVPQGSVAHPYQGKELFFELFRYLTGQGVYNGHNGYADYGTDDLQNIDVDRSAADWDSSIELLGRYVSPLTSDLLCSKIFTINFALNGSSQDDDSDAAIASTSAGGMVGINLSGSDNELSTVVAYLHDVDLARATSPFGTVPTLVGKQNVTSYFFTKPTPLNSNPPTFDRTTTEYAQAGGTNHPFPFGSNPVNVVNGVRAAMQQILSISTSFVSGSVPVNVFSRTQVLDDVYLALFQPDLAAKPFWTGNVKKLRATVFQIPCAIGASNCTATSEIRLTDSLGAAAIEDDGRITNTALTYWTDPTTITADTTRGILAGKDGRHVDRGGAGQKIPGFLASAGPGLTNATTGARQMYLYPGTGSSLVALNADASASVAYHAQIGAVDAAEALRVLKHIRGYDEYDADGDGNRLEVRPWMLADPLHSRPLPINYGAINGHTQDNPAIYIAVATNDGLLHFIRNTTSSGGESGEETWAFMPLDLLGITKALAINTPLTKRLYGLDGSPTVYIHDVDKDGNVESADGDRVYLFIGMRRGGRSYYALDVTDPTTPRFLWKASPLLSASASTSASCTASLAAGTGLAGLACALDLSTLLCTGDFCEMGWTFSQPKVGRVRTGVDSSGAPVIRPAVFFGGGYDTVLNDYSAATLALYKLGLASPGSINTDDLIGNAIYVVDAETGALIWKAVGPTSLSLPTGGGNVFRHAQLVDSIPSTLTIVDTNSDGLIDRIVTGDTGGNVWRADLGPDTDATPNGTADDWKLTLLAKLGRHAGTGKANDRRFFHEPDFVLSQDEAGPFDAVVLGSGDREDPLDYGREKVGAAETFAENWLYMIKDRKVGINTRSDGDPSTIVTHASLANLTDNCLQGGASSGCNPNLATGWKIQLNQGRGEKMLSAPLTAANRIYFTTYLPPRSNDSLTCGPGEGGGLYYGVGLKQATAVFNFNTADGGTADSPNSAADRHEALASSGIPTEVVYINLPDAQGNEVKCALGSDLTCRQMPGATRFRSFWYKDE